MRNTPETPYSNPLAPQWCYPDWGYHKYCESEFTYRFPLTTGPLTITSPGLMNQQLQFGFDAEYHITDWNVYGVDTAQASINTGIMVRLSDTFGKRRISSFVTVQQACGAVPADWIVSPGGTPRIDFHNTLGADCTIYIVFRGYKRFQNIGCPALPPDYQPVPYRPLWARYSVAPLGYVDEPFVFEFPVYSLTAPVDGVLQGFPFPLDTDAPFLLRGVEFDSTDSNATTRIGVRIVTPQGNRLVLEGNPASQTIPYALGTNFAGTTFTPALGRAIYPEILCPAGSTFQVDVSALVNAGTSVGTLRLNGVKRQKQNK